MKRRLTMAVPFLGVGAVFTAMAADRAVYLVVGLALLVVGFFLLVRGTKPGAPR
jgi:hypothetical protein